MNKEILKYLEQGISIDGNPKDGYTVFTIKTQHFKISSLDELSVERFEKAISDFNRREELENQLLREMKPVQHDLDWRGFIDGKYDNPKQNQAMNQEQIIDEAYKHYLNETRIYHYPDSLILLKEEFINKIKSESDWSESYDLKIEERDLTREERIDLYAKEYTPGMRNKYEPPFDDFIDAKLSVRNIPTKLITITYNNETIESYE